jgi:tRNA threonylcarbamoyladenosine biosynthesis protein TsaB
MPCLLAFDTATERMAVALQTASGRWCANEPGGAAASATLLPCIERLLGQAGIGHADLDAIAFGRGPGAFTGLRTSCAVAQGLGFGAARPVIALDSLLAVAEDARVQVAPEAASLDVGVAMDARMGEVYAARYRWDGRRWHATEPPTLLSLAALSAAWAVRVPAWVAGSALDAFGDRLPLPGARRVPAEADRAAALAVLAGQAWADGIATDAALALPLYLRDKVALTTREREAARAGA